MAADLFSTSLTAFGLFAIGLLGILCGSAILYLYLRGTSSRSTSQQDAQSIEFLKTLLSASPHHWVVWVRSKDLILCDHETAQRLGLPENGQTALDDLLACLVSEDQVRFKEYLEASPMGSNMTLSLCNGAKIAVLRSATRKSDYDVLWIAKDLPAAGPNGSDSIATGFFESLPWAIWFRGPDNSIDHGNALYHQLCAEDESFHDFLAQTKTLQAPLQKTIVLKDEPRYFHFQEFDLLQKPGRVGYAIDMTDQFFSHDKLEKDNTALCELVNQLNVGITIYGEDQKLSFYNPAYCQMFDFQSTWLDQNPSLSEVLDNLHQRRLLTEQADFPAYKQKWGQMFNSFATPKQELIHLPDERSLRMLAAPFGKAGAFFVFENITEQLVLERKVNTQAAVNQEVLDQLQEGVIVFASDNRLKLANPAFAKMWRLLPDAIAAGRHISDLMEDLKSFFCYGQNWSRYKQHLIESLTDRQPKTGNVHRKDGSVLSFAYVPLPDGTHLLSYTDISDTHRIRQALTEHTKALEAANTLKENFLTNLSENLKAPLETIIGFSDILIHQYFGHLNSQQLAYGKGIFKASNTLLSNIKAMLDLSALQTGKMSLNLHPIDINQLLISVVNTVQESQHHDKVRISTSFAVNLQLCVADERRLKQVFIELIHNAIHSLPSDGQISITVEGDQEEIVIRITDNGSGISPEDQPQLFDLFKRTKTAENRYPGAGLGLSLVKGIVELHQGQISLQSTYSVGTTVTCRLPRHLPQSAQKTLPKIA